MKKNTKILLIILGGIFLIIILAGIAGSGGSGSKTPKTNTTPPNIEVTSADPARVRDAQAIHDRMLYIWQYAQCVKEHYEYRAGVSDFYYAAASALTDLPSVDEMAELSQSELDSLSLLSVSVYVDAYYTMEEFPKCELKPVVVE